MNVPRKPAATRLIPARYAAQYFKDVCEGRNITFWFFGNRAPRRELNKDPSELAERRRGDFHEQGYGRPGRSHVRLDGVDRPGRADATDLDQPGSAQGTEAARCVRL